MKHKSKSFLCSMFVMLSACGGGTNSDNAGSEMPPPPVNLAPTLNVTASKSVVTEGQVFVLDASASTDPEGDTLTFSWSQLSGTNVTIGSPSDAQQNLTAPLVEANESLEFSVLVSDGVNSVSEQISIDVSDLVAIELASETSSFSNSIIKGLIGLTPDSSGGFRAYWGRGGSFAMPTSSQDFDGLGEKIGNQVDGEFFTGFFEWGNEFENVILSGGSPHYMLTSFRIDGLSPGFGPTFIGVSFYKDIVEGRINTPGDEIFVQPSPDFYSQDSSAMIQDDVLSSDHIISIFASNARPRDAFGNIGQEDYSVNAAIVNSDGSDSNFQLDTSSDIMGHAAVAPLTGGNFVAVYGINSSGNTELYMTSANIDGSIKSVRTPISESTIVGGKFEPNAARFSSGDALIVWRDNNGSTTDNEFSSVQGRIINNEANFVTSEFTVNITSAGNQLNPHIQPLNADRALVVWENSRPALHEIRGVVVNSSGETVSNEFLFASRGIGWEVEDFYSAHLSDDRVALGWKNRVDETSHIIIFDPI